MLGELMAFVLDLLPWRVFVALAVTFVIIVGLLILWAVYG